VSARLASFLTPEVRLTKERIEGSRLSGAAFKREYLAEHEKAAVLAEFGGEGLVTDVVRTIGDGKEATVYLCRADPSTGVEYLAAKVYRAQKFRAFAGARSYARERGHHDARSARAIRAQTDKGRRLAHHDWIAWEWETLCRVHDAGADVPSPLACSDDAILMEYVGSGELQAPQLRHVELERARAAEVLRRLLRTVEIFLDCHLVHADLSAYNVLLSGDRPYVIDVPQAIDARTHPDPFPYLLRDVRNLERYFAPHGLDAGRFAEEAWRRYRRGGLGR
jgi:RIO kinase 1